MSFYEHVFIMRQDLSNTQAEALIEEFSNVLAQTAGPSLSRNIGASKPWRIKSTKTARATMPF